MKYRKAVFILVYAIVKNKPQYLLLKRKLHWQGWEFPKGGRKKFETKKKAVKRELKEETGLKPKNIKKFNYKGKYNYDREFPDRLNIKGQTFHLFAVEVKKPKQGKINIEKREHSDYAWTDYKMALKKIKFKNQKKALKIVNKWLEK